MAAGQDLRAKRDELLVVRCQLGERAAFDELIQAWQEPLWHYARRVTGRDEAAQDVTQDVWMRVLRGIVRLEDGTKLRPWLFGIARHVLMDRLREQYAIPVERDADVAAIASETVDPTIEADVALMHDGLARLPVIEREALTLFYLQELSLAEVADILTIPVGTVKSRLFRARQLLRRQMETGGSHS